MFELSIIIVNYNTADLIVECLESFIQTNQNITLQIIIIDNSSSVINQKIITESFPNVEYVDMKYNAGFARANNEGIKRSLAPVILLLNPDTIIIGDAIQGSYNNLIKSNYVAAGVQLLNLDGTPQISGNFAMTGGLNYLLPLPFLGPIFKSLASLLKVKSPNIPDSNNIEEVDWINGAYIMVKKSAIDKAGLLDEDFFMYAEESEWCGRLKKVGDLCIFGQYKVTHLQGSSTNKTFKSATEGYRNLFDKKGLQIMVSNLVRIRKQFGLLWFLIIAAIYIIEIPVFLLGVIISKVLGRCSYSYENVKGYTYNISELIKLFPKIIPNKKHFYKML